MSRHSIFSEREEEVIACLLHGKSNKQIALALHITVRTVEFHLGNIYSRLQVASRSEAIIKLSNRQLWESTGKPENDELRQATVVSGLSRPTAQGWSPSENLRPL